ncbi:MULTISPECIES: DmsA/YnfE/YnfF family dimethyl sulfoxide reductase [unclassified Vibrio]|jgi:anaerobic dimethyl sulfoxide reductase subunit A|uniref:DmsA/YnfE/YnfF family dimethyl sulfoxide reductase n=1 Tax=unclassified Vibrio TaxID=2614977 RepID=UPI000307377F|nr:MULTISPECIES: DmsA/YnfE/YnfF family dimethyl sulfoxide reductase [unclassified Vibrio]ANP76256.1 dimethyl sulfoxide reductase subunit A [Vibrio crassostreae 9CS106]PMK23322.1 dimethyl sulfoxide reductase subunit A [Vibrio sp. 10N.261.54.C3]PML71267.1 dimethyl sulfoxide reductase subunit A [Vibrio sp. 10N.261.51.A7]TKF42498.1 dimethyl sulfoxide reductase subunit A [Vibrio sp. F13]TKF69026.1 dimethyl sulfoxide reductase subunit A [Vibrio sp. F13]
MTNKKESGVMNLTRRGFMKASSAVGSAAALAGGIALPFKSKPVAAAVAENVDEKIVWSACTVNCGSRCPLRMHVQNGEIKYVETDNTGTDEYGHHQVRACLRGRSMRRRVYNPDRLKYPMKRVGKRGEGKFKRISWEEAYDEVAGTMQRLIKDYGNDTIYLNYGTGTLGGTVTKSWPPAQTLIARLMNLSGGYLNHYGDYSTAQITKGLSYTYGGWANNNSFSDLENTKLNIQFGNNPAETRMSGGGQIHHYVESKNKSNARTIIIDPRYTDTAGGREDQWIPIRPSTDAALVAGLAHVMITEDLVDQPFLDKYCVGYDEKTLPASAPKNSDYKSYILGLGEDGVEKTPEWASKITGIPVDTIVKLGREMGTAKPCAIHQGWGLQRTANGELACRAIAMLSLLTGSVGVSGGSTGARESDINIPFVRFPTVPNPVETSISMFMWTDAIYRHHEMTDITDGVRGAERLKNPIKMIWNYAGNCIINQHSDINKTHAILQDESACEMIVVVDNHMTSSAKYADIILPDLTTSEQDDWCMDGKAANMPYFIYAQKAIEPQFEAKSIYEMCTQLAKRMGVEKEFTEGRTQEQWIEHLYAETRKNDPTLPTFEEMKELGIYKRSYDHHYIAYEDFRKDPEANPLTTPSGKIEIYSEQLADIAKTWKLKEDEVIHPLPIYADSFEGHNDPLAEKYPLQLTGFHYKARTHSTYGNVAEIKAAAPQELWINPIDAKERGIESGDMVSIFNDRGEVHIPAKVTPRILPRVVALGEGAWYAPDGQKIDHAGSINVLTTQRPSPLAKGNPQHTNLVQIKALKKA